jgi:DNA mismatch repair protein MutS
VRTRGKGRAPHLTHEVRDDVRRTIDIDSAGDTPILREYRTVKAEHPDAIVLARLGDFYEMFGPDAEIASPILGVALTGRSFGSAGRVPMCGVPFHAATQHVRRLLDAGRRVVLWDQVGEVTAGKLVRREVTRVLSAGTAIDAELLEPEAVLRCVAIVAKHERTGIAALDASTGDLELIELPCDVDSAAVTDELLRLDVGELILSESVAPSAAVLRGVPRTVLPDSLFDEARADARVASAAGVAALLGLGVDDVPIARAAAGAVLAYCERARIVMSPELLRIRVTRPDAGMRLDAGTRRNLELLAPHGHGVSLLGLLDRTRTPMGGRLLRAWLQEPLLDRDAIAHRAAAVEALVRDAAVRDELGAHLRGVRDVARMVARCAQGTATPRDLGALRDACNTLPEIRAAVIALAGEPLLADTADACVAPPEVTERLTSTLADDLPATDRDAGSIRPGADAELDRLMAAGTDARDYLADLERTERERTGIRSLRVGYNRVFGYYIEVPNAQRGSVPPGYERKQTLVGAERYVTAELKEQEAIVLHARDLAIAREQQLLRELASMVAGHAAQLERAAGAVALLDAVRSLAQVAAEEAWVRPVVDDSEVIDIEAGRHPLVERSLGPGRFVPNDCTLDAAERVVILTGPNMAGKSTYLRQVAIIVLMAQVGSFVPASRARIGVCDRIFTRIGAHDDLSAGMSTFMVEMGETAAILRQATGRSLVILDEIGRGTSTYDGLSIAQAVVEHLHDSPHLGCRTLFATHYHELTALASSLARVRNARVEVAEEGGAVTFLHRIVAGGADRSYGIHVAKLAGVPTSVLIRARDLLAELERARPLAGGTSAAAQLWLDISETTRHPLLSELVELDLDRMSPIAALNKLAELRERATP